MRNGIQFTTDGQYGRNEVRGYHGSPRHEFKTSAAASDIAGLKTRQPSSELVTAQNEARFRIGMEIEKNSMTRSSIKEYPLFKGFERDSTCGGIGGGGGIEAITHVLPLLPKSHWRSKVFNMFHEAERVIEDSHSPSDASCSTHTHLSVATMNGTELLEAVRPYSGIIYALFRYRLANYYALGNPFLNTTEGYGCSSWECGTKYCVVKNTGHGIEFRLPSRIKSVKGMIRRYELFFELVNFGVNHAGKSHASFLKRITPIIKRMYDTQEEVDNILTLAKAFQKAINNNRVCAVTREWFEGDHIRHQRSRRDGDMSLFYTRALARETGNRYRTNEEINSLI
jgi:hypothetical protein